MEKTILITGASSGIGRATAWYFSHKAWNVIATMRQPDRETELTRLPNVFVTELDVQKPETINAVIQQGIGRFGGIDVLVNNAGYGEFGLFEAASDEQVRMQFDVNLFGAMQAMRAILPHYRERKQGTIINISSGAGRFTLPLISLYSASKFALEGFSEAVSFELAALNIFVKIVEPGGTNTNFSNVSNEREAQKHSLEDYDAFLVAARKMFDVLRGMQLASADDAASVIYTAATDGTDTLRYVVGNTNFKRRIEERLKMPDLQYVQYMQSVRNSYMKFM
jgi:NAD(P)-dependent dehydrogenase (short-subunit alcohol dehydrogenase family)